MYVADGDPLCPSNDRQPDTGQSLFLLFNMNHKYLLGGHAGSAMAILASFDHEPPRLKALAFQSP